MLLDFLSFFTNTLVGYSNNPARTRCFLLRSDVDYDPIDPQEIDVFTVEFTNDLQNGRTIGDPVFLCTVLRTDDDATVDTSPSSRVLGAANITTGTFAVSGATRTYANQKFGTFISGNLYSIVARVIASDGSAIQRQSRVYCRSPN